MLRRGVHGPVEEAVGHDGVGAVLCQEPVEGLPKQLDRLEELVSVGIEVEGRHGLDAGGQPDVREGHDGDVDGQGAIGAAGGLVGAVHRRADDRGVHGGGEDGALDAAGGEERGHVGGRDEVPRHQEREEEHAQRLLLTFDRHG